jgi:hypothetical protein
MRQRTSILESAKFLVLVGILAGVVGGLAIGIVTGRAPSSSAAGTSK